jgi:hypothetical protein
MSSFLKVIGCIMAYMLVNFTLFWVFVGPTAYTLSWNQSPESFADAQLTCNLIVTAELVGFAAVVWIVNWRANRKS